MPLPGFYKSKSYDYYIFFFDDYSNKLCLTTHPDGSYNAGNFYSFNMDRFDPVETLRFGNVTLEKLP